MLSHVGSSSTTTIYLMLPKVLCGSLPERYIELAHTPTAHLQDGNFAVYAEDAALVGEAYFKTKKVIKQWKDSQVRRVHALL